MKKLIKETLERKIKEYDLIEKSLNTEYDKKGKKPEIKELEKGLIETNAQIKILRFILGS